MVLSMQINSVSYVNLADSREAVAVAASDDAELKSRDSSLSAVSETAETDDSGRQTEQKPSDNNSQYSSELTEQELQQIQKLEARDREVRVHEQAHQSAGGQYTGAASFTYQRGPDGLRYAVGGEVSIDTSKVEGNPQATLEKAEVIRRAALAPAEPSAQDRQVAATASQMKLEAQAELAVQRVEESNVSKSDETEEKDDADVEASSESSSGQEEREIAQQVDSTDRSNQESDKEERSSTEFVDASLSPEDLTNLLASEIARRNAMAVFENINREPPKGNLDELV